MVALNRAVALAEVEGAEAGLAALEGLPLEEYYLLHAVRADLLRRLGRNAEAAAEYESARAFTDNEAERAFLRARRSRRDPAPAGDDRLGPVMKVHLVDGTYELFRHFFGAPPHRNAAGREVAAVRGVVGSVLQLLSEGATHVGVATDHVIESFRNDLWPGYKTGDGVDPDLWSQAWPLEEALAALGVSSGPWSTLEADDALASAAAVADDDPGSSRWSSARRTRTWASVCVAPGSCSSTGARTVIDEAGVVPSSASVPASIPDYLALVGDSADGFPGLAGWGAKSAAAVLARWGHVEDIPPDPADWDVTVRGAAKLAATLQEGPDDAALFKELATLRVDRSLLARVEDLRWRGPTGEFARICAEIDAPGLLRRAEALAPTR